MSGRKFSPTRLDSDRPGALDLLPELLAVGVPRVLLEEPVQEGDVARVDATLDALQPVALPESLERERVLIGAR